MANATLTASFGGNGDGISNNGRNGDGGSGRGRDGGGASGGGFNVNPFSVLLLAATYYAGARAALCTRRVAAKVL